MGTTGTGDSVLNNHGFLNSLFSPTQVGVLIHSITW